MADRINNWQRVITIFVWIWNINQLHLSPGWMAGSSCPPPGLWLLSASHTMYLSALSVQASWRIGLLMMFRSLWLPTTSSRPSSAYGSSVAPAISFLLVGTIGSASLWIIQILLMASTQQLWHGGTSSQNSLTLWTHSSLSFARSSPRRPPCMSSTMVLCLSPLGGLLGKT